MTTRIVLYADEGKGVLTNGEIYGKQIFLAEDAIAEAFYEITDAEYEQIIDVDSEEGEL